jgi:hypothetical protein
VPDEPAEAGQPAQANQPGGARSPGWREVLLLAGAILAAVFALELVSLAFPQVREAFRVLPLTVVVLVGGTVGLLVLAFRRRSRP